MSCSQESRVAIPSKANFGSMRWLRSRQRSKATASGKTWLKAGPKGKQRKTHVRTKGTSDLSSKNPSFFEEQNEMKKKTCGSPQKRGLNGSKRLFCPHGHQKLADALILLAHRGGRSSTVLHLGAFHFH